MPINRPELIRQIAQSRYRKPAANIPAQSDFALQQTVAAAPAAGPSTGITSLAQKLGGAIAEQTGKAQVAQVQTQAAQSEQAGKAALAQQQETQRAAEAQGKLAIQEKRGVEEQRLAGISEQAKREVFDLRKQFVESGAEKKFSNERQLADFERLTAKSDADWENYKQNVELASDRKTQILDISLKRIRAGMEQMAAENEQLLNQMNDINITARGKENARRILAEKQRLREELAAAEASLKKSIADQQARAANVAGRNAALGSLAGAVIGGALAVPTGGVAIPIAAGIGSQLGSGIGTLVGPKS